MKTQLKVGIPFLIFHVGSGRGEVLLRTGGRKRDPAKVANLVENHFQITIIITNAVLKKASVYIV